MPSPLTPLSAAGNVAWDEMAAAHLLNRAGFGGTWEEIRALHARGAEGAVEWLLAGARGEPTASIDSSPSQGKTAAYTEPQNLEVQRRERQKLDEEGRRAFNREVRKRHRQVYLAFMGAWLREMTQGASPLREKLALFWHGHFATSQTKVRDPYYLWVQKETFRRLALAELPVMVKAMLRDPAMLLWLDGDKSRAGSPNENFAREVMELFTLGEGHYTEGDVAEAARAFTGYRVNPADQSFRFAPLLHDDGPKVLFGKRGHFTGEEVVDLLCGQPACARFMSAKLLRYFVCEAPSPEWVEAVAQRLAQEKMALEPVLRAIFLSEAFYKERRSQVKGPVEWLVNATKVLGTPLPPYNASFALLSQLGQIPYQPPNVKGWDGGKSWMTTSTLLARYNFAAVLCGLEAIRPTQAKSSRRGKARQQFLSPRVLGDLPEELRREPVALVQHFALVLYQEPLEEGEIAAFTDFLRDKPLEGGTLKRLLHLMMSTPEFQLT